jgi:hypothetical protein
MLRNFRTISALRLFCLSVFTLLLAGPLWASGSTTVVISQMFGGGGSAAGTFNADYVELFNVSSSSVDISGWSIQYGAATSTTNASVYTIPANTTPLAPGQYFLIADPQSSGLASLPITPDVTTTFTLSATAGKVFLVNNSTAIAYNSAGCAPSTAGVVDFIGYGTTANCYEGSGPAPAPSTTMADVRQNASMTPCTDTDQNATDFVTAVPAPHNTASVKTVCSGVAAPATSITLSSSTSTATAGTSVTFTAVVSGNQSTPPTGTVKFYDGTTLLGNGTSTVAGTYTYTTSALTTGPHSINIAYSGDSIYSSSTVSTPTSVSVTVTPLGTPDFTLSVANTSLIATDSTKTQQTVVTVNMVAGFSTPVVLTCSGLPGGSRCLFNPGTLSSSGNSTLTIGIDGAHVRHTSKGDGRVALALAALVLPLVFWRRKKLVAVPLALLLLGAMGLTLTGCGGGASTSSGTSTITVTGTAGSTTHTATLTLTVQ